MDSDRMSSYLILTESSIFLVFAIRYPLASVVHGLNLEEARPAPSRIQVLQATTLVTTKNKASLHGCT